MRWSRKGERAPAETSSAKAALCILTEQKPDATTRHDIEWSRYEEEEVVVAFSVVPSAFPHQDEQGGEEQVAFVAKQRLLDSDPDTVQVVHTCAAARYQCQH